MGPRFLDRLLRPGDVVTPLAVNPTTKRTRKGGISRRNPKAAKEHQTRQQHKQQLQRKNKKEAEPHLSEQEELELQQAWEQLRSQPLNSFGESTSTKTSLFRTVQLGDKQRRAWIPKAATNLAEMGTQAEMERFIQATAASAQHP